MKGKAYIKAKANRKRKSARIYRSGNSIDLIALLCAIIEALAKDMNMSPNKLVADISILVYRAGVHNNDDSDTQNGGESNGIL